MNTRECIEFLKSQQYKVTQYDHDIGNATSIWNLNSKLDEIITKLQENENLVDALKQNFGIKIRKDDYAIWIKFPQEVLLGIQLARLKKQVLFSKGKLKGL